jgi:hypothetical protein
MDIVFILVMGLVFAPGLIYVVRAIGTPKRTDAVKPMYVKRSPQKDWDER